MFACMGHSPIYIYRVTYTGSYIGIWGFLGFCSLSARFLLAFCSFCSCLLARFRTQFYFLGKTLPVRGQAPLGPGGGPHRTATARKKKKEIYLIIPLQHSFENYCPVKNDVHMLKLIRTHLWDKLLRYFYWEP